MNRWKQFALCLSPLGAVCVNLLLAFGVYLVARVAFFLENYSLFAEHFTLAQLPMLLRGGLRFDCSAIAYTHALYLLLVLFPLFYKETRIYHRVCQWFFVVVNTLGLLINLADAVYFPYTHHRTTTAVFEEFANERHLGGIVWHEVLRHWYFVLLVVLVAYALWRLYRTPRVHVGQLRGVRMRLGYTAVMLVSLLGLSVLTVGGMRGGFTVDRPITLSNAQQYVEDPLQCAVVLNTPFALLRSIGKNVFTVPDYFPPDGLEGRFSPVHGPVQVDTSARPNVVLLIVESFGREYIGAFNPWLDSGRYAGFTPCVDSLIAQSLVFRHSFCNGLKSIDAMPSILAGIPMFKRSFILTPAAMNDYSGVGEMFGRKGYETAFFHGAERKSMGFLAFSKKIGYRRYYSLEDFVSDGRFGGRDDFDGTWGIWDEPFLQYFCAKMGELREPFLTTVFTLSSHHPFRVPARYRDTFPEGELEIHKCIRYTDMALGRFFAAARKQPWFANTIFFIFSDHTNMSNHAEYRSNIGMFSSPFIIYDPSGGIAPGVSSAVAQQIDLLPTLAGLLGYDRPYLSFGCDLLHTPSEQTYAVNYANGVYQYVRDGYVLQFDGQRSVGLYALEDRAMRHNLLGEVALQATLEAELKAIIQQYMYRMVNDKLRP